MDLIDRVGKEKLIELLSTLPIRKINRDYGYSRNALLGARRKLGIDAHDQYMEHKDLRWPDISSSTIVPKSYNEFLTVNDEWSSYWLGFIFADGCVYECKRKDSAKPYRGLRIGLGIKDRCHLEMFSSYSGMKVSDIAMHNKQSGKTHMSCCVRRQSPVIADNLIAFGVIPRKSTTDHYMPNIPDHLMPHFIRGYFDGDGCIMTHDDGRPKLVSILGRKTFLDGISNWLNNHYVATNYVNMNTYYDMRISSMLDVNRFYHLIYQDATIFLQRKYKKFNNINGLQR